MSVTAVRPTSSSRPPGMREPTVALSIPESGIVANGLCLRFPVADDLDAWLPAFEDPEIREPANLPSFGRDELMASLDYLPAAAASGRLMPLVVLDAVTSEIVGGAILHHLDAEREIVEIGYFVLPHARRQGFATRIARTLAEHAFSLGIKRVAAYVNVGNILSERVLERAGFTREGVVRSLPKPDGRRIDKTLFSLLPGE